MATPTDELSPRERLILFWASFIALAAAGFGFAFRIAHMGSYGQEFGLTGQQIGNIAGSCFWPIAITMILFSLVVDKTGYKVPMFFAAGLQAISGIGTSMAGSYEGLLFFAICAGLGHGIIEAVTGTGKTLAAIACMADATTEVPDLRFAVVVPSQQLARQWAAELQRALNLPEGAVGLRMTGKRASFRTHRIVVWVIDSARRSLAADCAGHPVMLVVDECHRSGSPKNLRIYDAQTRFRLGLSATARRRAGRRPPSWRRSCSTRPSASTRASTCTTCRRARP